MHRKLLVSLALLIVFGIGGLYSACDDLVTEVTEVTVYGPPEAEFDVNVDVGCKDSLVVQFTDESTGFGIVDWVWIFNENLPESLQDTSYEQNPTYTYRGAGFYDVRLIVTDSLGNADGELKTRYVWLTKPEAIFTILPTNNGCQDTRFELHNQSIGISNDFTWYIANPDISYLDSTYRTQVDLQNLLPGTYTITLIADGGDSCGVDTLVDTLVVGNCPQFTFTVNGIDTGRDSICEGDNVTVEYVDSGGPIDSLFVNWGYDDTLYDVYQGNPGILVGGSPYNGVSDQQSNSYSVDVIASGPGGVDTATLANIINVFIPLEARFATRYDVNGTDSISPTFIEVSNTSTGRTYGQSYEWLIEIPGTDGSQLDTIHELTPDPDDIPYDSAGSYIIRLTGYNNCNIGSPTVWEDTIRIYDSTEVK